MASRADYFPWECIESRIMSDDKEKNISQLWKFLKNCYHTSADFSMFGYGCGVSQYPQFIVEDLYIYQMLPRPYLRSFYGGPGDKLIIKRS